MAVRAPLYLDGSNDLVEMTTTHVDEWEQYMCYLYGGSPSVTLSQVGSGGTLTITGTTAGTFSGALSGTTVAMTGNITTTADIAANTASVLTGSCITADGAIGMGVEQATPSQPASGKGLLYMKDGEEFSGVLMKNQK